MVLLVVATGAPAALGGAVGWTGFVVAACATAGAAVCLATLRGRTAWDEPATVLGVVVGLGMVWTAFQATPLPVTLLRALAPQSVADVETTRALLGLPAATTATLSRDPGSTMAALVLGAGSVAGFVLGWAGAASNEGKWVVRAVGLGAGAVATLTWLHVAVGARLVYGVYEPQEANPVFLGPLLNQNHLAGLMSLGFPVLLSLGLGASGRTSSATWFASAALVGMTGALTPSRSGVAALGLAGVTFAGAHLLRSNRERAPGRAAVALLGTVATVTAVAAAGLLRALQDRDYSKLDLLSASAALAADNFWVGVGRGAFPAAFAERMGGALRFTHPENLLLQWASEWGTPFSALLLLLVGVPVAWALRFDDARHRIGAATGLAAMGVQNQLDFGLELVGIAVVAAMLLGMLARTDTPSQMRIRSVRAGTVATSLVVAASAALVLVGPVLPRASTGLFLATVDDWRGRPDGDRLPRPLFDAVRLHPAEPAVALLAAHASLRQDDASALRWANRTAELAPEWPGPRLVAGTWLLRRGRLEQGLLELSEAEERVPGAAVPVACANLRGHGEATAAAVVGRFGQHEAGRRFLDDLAHCLPVEGVLARRVDEYLLSSGGGRLSGPLVRSMHRAIRAEDRDAVLALVSRLSAWVEDAAAPPAGSVLALARGYVATDRPDTAIRALRVALAAGVNRGALLPMLARAQAASGDLSGMRDTVASLRASTASDASGLARAARLLGTLEESSRNYGRALRAYQDAHGLDPAPSTEAAIRRVRGRLDDRGSRPGRDERNVAVEALR